MELFLEMFFTAVVAVLFSFVVAKLVSVAMAGSVGNGGSRLELEEKSVSDVDESIVMEETLLRQKMDAWGYGGERRVRFVGETVGNVDQFGGEAVLVKDLEELATGSDEIGAEGEELAVEAESEAVESREDALDDDRIVEGKGQASDSVEERNECVEDVVARESEGVRVSESESKSRIQDKIQELDIQDDDDWEGIERSDVEKAFAAAAKFLEESEQAAGIRTDVKTKLYGLHKIATEGSYREPQPMALLLSARAKWNALQKLGNMTPEVAMEQYLELLSKEIPGWMKDSSLEENKPEVETSSILPPDCSSLDLPNTSNVKGSKPVIEEGDVNGASSIDKKASSE